MVCNVMYSMETLNMRVLNRRPLEVPPCYSLPPTHGSSFKSVWLSEFEHFKINTGHVPRKILVLVAFSFNFLPCKNLTEKYQFAVCLTNDLNFQVCMWSFKSNAFGPISRCLAWLHGQRLCCASCHCQHTKTIDRLRRKQTVGPISTSLPM